MVHLIVEAAPALGILIVDLAGQFGAKLVVLSDLNRGKKRHELALLGRREPDGFLFELGK